LSFTTTPSFTGLTVTGAITATNQTETIQNIILTGVTSNPGSPAAGQLIFRSDLSQFFGYNGTAWIIVG
jgi:hypothetical protein